MPVLTLAGMVVALLLASPVANAQIPAELFLDPAMLLAGAGETDLRIYRQDLRPGLSIRWNGIERPVTRDTFGSYYLKLSAEDVASPGLAELTLVNPTTGAVVASRFVPIGYNVIPRDVVYDRARKRFYITTPERPGDSRFPGNSIVALDPENGNIGPILSAGNAPGSLALTDDGSALYAAVDGDGLIRRVDPERLTVISELRFRPAVSRNGGPYFGAAIAVMPGTTQTVAVYYHPDTGSSLTRMSVYDNGVKRMSEIGSFDGFDSLMFSPDRKYLFLGSHKYFNTSGNTLRYSVDDSGIPAQMPVAAAGGGPILAMDGILYTSHGTLIDYGSMELVSLLGVGGSVAVDKPTQRILAVYFQRNANASFYPQYLQAFDFATQQPLGWLTLDAVDYFGAGQNPSLRLMRFGSDGLLYTGSRGLIIFRTPLAGPAPVIDQGGITNDAGEPAASVSPGETIVINGTNLGADTPQTATENPVTKLGHVQVWFDRLPGRILLVSRNQIKVIAPAGLIPGSNVMLQVWYFGLPSARIPLGIGSAAPKSGPDLVTGAGQ